MGTSTLTTGKPRRQARATIVQAVRGKYRHVRTSSRAFAAAKLRDFDREDRRR
jgi:hypothetical protein